MGAMHIPGRAVALAMLLRLAGSVAAAEPPRNDYAKDIEAMDHALATADPNAPWVVFGDVGIKHADLRAYRDRLAGGLTPERSPSAVTPPGTTYLWPGGVVPYRFDPAQVGNGTIDAMKMEQFRDGIAEWSAFANLHFVENISGQAHYITVQEDTGLGGGFSSSVGRDAVNAEQFLRFGPSAWNRGTVCHEMGHALGLFHEQQRPDRDAYVIINWSNIDPGQQANFAIISNGATHATAYDFYSVMHYRRDALTNNGKDTIGMQPAHAAYAGVIGNVYDRTLSKIERAAMAALYGAASPAPSAVVSNTKDSGPGSLRTAIYFALDRSLAPAPLATTITFQIPTSDSRYDAGAGVFTIRPTAMMTSLGNGTTIDGSSQAAFTGDTNSGGPEIALDGTRIRDLQEPLGIYASGLTLRAASCVIKGLAITNFNVFGIEMFDGGDPNGSTSTNNLIGGTAPASRNVIAGNDVAGIALRSSTTTANVISGNFIGVDQSGTVARSNGAGVSLYSGAHGNTVGGSVPESGNVLSGNTYQGVFVHGSGTSGNAVRGNFIGTNAAGNASLPNSTGISIVYGAGGTIIGGAGSGNVISGNVYNGIDILDAGTDGTIVQGNVIGLAAGGSAPMGNGGAGILIFGGASSTAIGSDSAADRNFISANGYQGIAIAGAGTNGTTVRGNHIGVDATGLVARANGSAGISIYDGAQSTTVGGSAAGSGNVISGNFYEGVTINDPGTSANQVLGNLIGVNKPGTAAISNGSAGISVFGGAHHNTIGGAAGARNVVSGNVYAGLVLDGSATNGNIVAGNYVGLDITGINPIGNGAAGVAVFNGAHDNSIGGTSPGSRNVIGGNGYEGITIADPGTNGNLVQGNTIGLNVGGAPVANGAPGIALFGGAQSNLIGGSTTGASNVISANTYEGVAMFDATTLRNTVSQNSIFANPFSGIGLFGGANAGQPAPALNGAVLGAAGNTGGTDVAGALSGAVANTTYRIEFFASPPGGDEGQFFVGSANVTTNASGAASFVSLPVHLAAAVPKNHVVTATATDPNGNTSSFSGTVIVSATDTDGDGMPDAWETAHGSNPNSAADASSDGDHDGDATLVEFRNGTDPQSAASRLRILVDRVAGNARVSFQPVAGKTYRLEGRDELIAGTWRTLVEGVFAPSAATLMLDDESSAVARRHYRVVSQP